MIPALLHHSLAQGGVFSTSQALKAGYTRDEIRGFIGKRREWVRVRRGVFATAETAEAWSLAERQMASDRAASLNMTTAHLLSHDSAARLLGLPLVSTKDSLIHITRPGVEGTRTDCGVRHHLGKMPPGAMSVGAFRTTDLARTALDIGREHGLVAGVCAADQVLRRGVGGQAFLRELDLMGHWPHIKRARQAISMADPGADSPAESLARLCLLGLDRGQVRTQFPFPMGDGRRSAWADLVLGPLVVEVDGRVKYDEGEPGALWQEKLRQHAIERQPVLVERVVWEEVLPRSWSKTMNRLAAAYERAVSRFGPGLPPEIETRAARLAAERHRRIFGSVLAS